MSQRTEAQERAIVTLDRNVALVAGAGAGKTMVLVERILEMLDQTSFDGILALTFTEKAAQEMRERCIDRLLQRASDAEPNDPDTAGRYRQLALEAHTAAITTIDSFCARTLREFAAAADVDPLYRVLDPVDAHITLTSIIDATCQTVMNDPGEPVLQKHFLQVLKTVSPQQLPALITQVLATAPAHIDDWRHYCARDTDEHLNDINVLIKQATTALLSQAHFCADLALLRDARVSSFDQWLQSFDVWQQAENPIALLTQINTPDKVKMAGIAPADKPLVKSANQALTRIKKHLKSLDDPCFDRDANLQRQATLVAIAEIAFSCWERFEAHKSKLNAYTFADIMHRTRALIRHNSAVQKHLRQRYHYVLVDEFQDTNAAQLELTEDLCRPDNLFVVGDPKQSIYAFRGADVSVFNHLLQHFQNGDVILLEHNFRTLYPLLEGLNKLFASVFFEKPKFDYQVAAQALIAGRSQQQKTYDPERLRFDDIIPMADTAVKAPVNLTAALAQQLCQRITTTLEQQPFRIDDGQPTKNTETEAPTGENKNASAPPGRKITLGDFCILLPTMTHVTTFEKALRAAHLPFRNESSRGFYHTVEIQSLYTLLRAFTHPHDDVNFASFLKLPFCNIDDHSLDALLRHRDYDRRQSLRRNAERLGSGVSDALAICLEKTRSFTFARLPVATFAAAAIQHFDVRHWIVNNAIEVDQALANIDKFLAVIANYCGQRAIGKRHFIERFADIVGNAKESEAEVSTDHHDCITIMTVHASKGLQFPIVMLPAINRLFRHTFDAIMMHHDDNNRCHFGYRGSDDKGTSATDIVTYHAQNSAKLRALEEEKRLLYVACTRAQEALFVIGCQTETKTDETASDPVASTAAVTAIKARAWQDWLRPFFQNHPELSIYQQVTPVASAPASTRKTTSEKSYKRAQCVLKTTLDPWQQCATTDLLDEFPNDPSWTDADADADADAETEANNSPITQSQDSSALTEKETTRHTHKKKPRGLSPALYGTVTHKVFEHIQRDGSLDHATVLRQLGYHKHVPRTVSRAITEITAGIQQRPRLQGILHPDARIQVFNEPSFTLHLDHHLITGQIDRLHIDVDHVTVIDYKTNALDVQNEDSDARADSRRRLADHYKPQMDCYVLAALRLFAPHANTVSACLYFHDDDSQVDWQHNRCDINLLTSSVTGCLQR